MEHNKNVSRHHILRVLYRANPVTIYYSRYKEDRRSISDQKCLTSCTEQSIWGVNILCLNHLRGFAIILTSSLERFRFEHNRDNRVGIPEISLNTRGELSRYTGNIVEHTGKPESVYRKYRWTYSETWVGVPEKLNTRGKQIQYTGNLVEHTGKAEPVYRKYCWTRTESRACIPEISLNTRGKQSRYTGNIVETWVSICEMLNTQEFSSVRFAAHPQHNMEHHIMP
jgi:hypothetical protein